jgi:hypothetical protein
MAVKLVTRSATACTSGNTTAILANQRATTFNGPLSARLLQRSYPEHPCRLCYVTHVRGHSLNMHLCCCCLAMVDGPMVEGSSSAASLAYHHALAAGLPAVGAAVQCSPPLQLLSTPTAQHQVLAGQQQHVTQPIHAHNALLARLACSSW